MEVVGDWNSSPPQMMSKQMMKTRSALTGSYNHHRSWRIRSCTAAGSMPPVEFQTQADDHGGMTLPAVVELPHTYEYKRK